MHFHKQIHAYTIMNMDKLTKLTNSIFSFLSSLSQNNNREWFSDNKKDYEKAKSQADSFCRAVYAAMQEKDHLGAIKIYRIYNDLRFAKDKPPYKTHFGLYFGRLQPKYRGGYYLHLSPEQSFVGGGFFNPEPKDLLRIRQEIAQEGEHFSQIMNSEAIRSYFSGQLWGQEVKTTPKGFDKDDPMITLDQVLGDSFFQEVVDTFVAMRPFYDFMTQALTTDANGEPLYN